MLPPLGTRDRRLASEMAALCASIAEALRSGVVWRLMMSAAFWSCVEAHDERCVLELCGGS